MALDAHEQEQQERLEALEYAINLLWREVAYLKNLLEDMKTKTD
jgi:hypothetical protein